MTCAIVLTLMSTLQAADPLEVFFSEFVEKRDKIATVEAQFTQKTSTAEETVTSTGTIVYQRPRRIVFRYDQPDTMVLLIDRQRMYEYDAELGQLRIYDLDDDPQMEALFLGMDDDVQRLRRAYAITLFDPEKAGDKGLTLIPIPKDDELPYFEQARLLLRGKDYLPYQVEIVQDPESQVVIQMSKFRVNKDLDPAKAQIAVPEGTKVIDNDTLAETVGPGGKRFPTPATLGPVAPVAPVAPATATDELGAP